jgi:hypothetical protein
MHCGWSFWRTAGQRRDEFWRHVTPGGYRRPGELVFDLPGSARAASVETPPRHEAIGALILRHFAARVPRPFALHTTGDG